MNIMEKTQKAKTKVVYLQVEDPISYKQSDVEFYEEDKEIFKLNVVRVAGILIHEDEKNVTIAEVSTCKDNPELCSAGVKYPRFRYVMTVSKKGIIERQDFTVTEKEA